MGQDRTPGSNSSRSDELFELARQARGQRQRELIQEWIREVKYIPKIRNNWRRWMGALPEWAQQGG